MDYYKKKIELAGLIFFMIYMIGFGAFILILYIFQGIGEDFSFAVLLISFGILIVIIVIGLEGIMYLWINYSIENAPNPRKMYWKFLRIRENFTDNYPEKPTITEALKSFPRQYSIGFRDNANSLLVFKENSVSIKENEGKSFTYEYDEIKDITIQSEIEYKGKRFKSDLYFKIYLKNPKLGDIDIIRINEIDTEIDEFEQIVENFRKNIQK